MPPTGLREGNMLKLILSDTNLCPSSCECFEPVKGERLVEYCNLPTGDWVVKVKDGELQECPLGKWDLKVAKGIMPTGD